MEFGLVDFPSPPFVQDVLIAREDRFHSQNQRTISSDRLLLQKRTRETLAGGQRMVIADQHQISPTDRLMHAGNIHHRLVGPVGGAKVFQILSPAIVIIGADFTLDSFESMQLRCGASRSQV